MKVKITITLDITDEFYEKKIKQLRADILSGNHQRELLEENKEYGLKNVKATFEKL